MGRTTDEVTYLVKDKLHEGYKVWLQAPNDLSGDGAHRASEEGRLYVDLSDESYGVRLDNFLRATLTFMEQKLGGYPDHHDPLSMRIVRDDPQGGGYIFGCSVCVSGTAQSGTGDSAIYGLGVSFQFPYGPNLGFNVMGVEMKLPIKAAVPLNWSAINDNDFERLVYRLFALDNEFDDVHWLQHTNAPDGGRDVSAVTIENNHRVLIQVKHYEKSISAQMISDTVTIAETWNPPFDEVIFVTSGTYTRDAIQWVENHNDRQKGKRPLVKIISGGEVEVMLTKHPTLISGLGLR